MNGKLDAWKQGCKDGIPICLGYIAVSFTFGIVAKNAGISVLQATLMSALNYTSAGQFAALGLIAAAAPYIEMAAAQLVINLRYSLMSCALSQKLEEGTSTLHRLIMSFGVTDEVFAVSASVNGRLSPFYTYGLMTVAMPAWAGGTALGVLLGGVMPAHLLSAFSIALYGMFLAIVIPPAKKSRVIAGVVVVSMLCSALFAVIPVLKGLSYGMRIIVLTLIIAGLAAVFFPVKEESHGG